VPRIDVIIVNWNAGAQLLECVNSVIKYGQGAVGKIIVVDNGSTDASEDSINGLPFVTLIRTGTNLGFGKACNLGAAQAKSDFVLFLNPDARLFPNSLPALLAFMERSENVKVGISGIQLVDKNGHVARSCSRFPSLTRFISHALGVDRIYPAAGHAMGEWDHFSTRYVDQVIGAFFLVRLCVFETLEGFDERFFVYFEEVDFSLRANQLGWSSVYFADVQAFHAGGGTSNQVKAKRLFYSLRSRILYVFKHFNLIRATAVLLVTLCIEPLSRTAVAIGRCSWSSVKETHAAYGMLFRWLPRWILNGVTR
jgi:GT2 family glycosyltransferase